MYLKISAKWRPFCPSLNVLIDGTCVRLTQLPVLSFTRWYMMMSCKENIFRVIGLLCGNSPVTGEFPAQRPVMRSFDVFFDLRPNKRLSKQSWGLWFETPSLLCNWGEVGYICISMECPLHRLQENTQFFTNHFVTWIYAYHISNPSIAR